MRVIKTYPITEKVTTIEDSIEQILSVQYINDQYQLSYISSGSLKVTAVILWFLDDEIIPLDANLNYINSLPVEGDINASISFFYTIK